ncbi:MAG: mechanosensitive ion channel [Planctomycetes bacterium]|nr:mechanosensitive ion channel [Planctomycetota bacterium]
MTELTKAILEILVAGGILLAAALITMRMRGWAEPGEERRPVFVAFLRFLAASLALPAAVFALTALALVLVRALVPELAAELGPLGKRQKHVVAWQMFWGIYAVVHFVEGMGLFIYHLRRERFPIPELLRNILRFVILLGAFFAILKFELDQEISTLLASTALISAVVGFALQGVLSNLLAGMSLHLVRSVMPSDWVSIDGVEGNVIAANWRETRIRTTGGHIMIIPNSAVAAATVHNLTRPNNLRRHVVNVGASYSDAPGDVIEALLESAASVPEVLRAPAPEAFVTEFKDFGINYALRFWTRRYNERPRIDGDVSRMIWYKFKRRGIEIPFPMSDKLLNDFMAVVYRQRRMPPEDDEVRRRAADLLASPFASKVLVGEDGQPLLSEDDLRGIARWTKRVQYTRGETIFRQGEAGESCFIIVAGRVKGRVEYEGAAHANEFELGPGTLFGEMSLVTGLPRTATISTDEEVELIEIPRDAFARLLAVRPEVPQILSRLVAERAAENAAAYEKIKGMPVQAVQETLRRENILKRFLRLIGAS